MSNLITDMVEGLGVSTIYYYKETPELQESTVIANRFDDLDISAVVAKASDLGSMNPEDIVKLVYENQLDGSGFLTNKADDIIILVSEEEDGDASFYYYSEDEEVVKQFEDMATSTDEDPGIFLLNHLNEIEEIATGTKPIEVEEVIPEEETETEEVVVESSDTGSETPVMYNLTFSLLAVIVAGLMIFFFVRDTKKRRGVLRPGGVSTLSKKEEKFNVVFEDEKDLMTENEMLREYISYQYSLGRAGLPDCYKELNAVQRSFLRLWRTAQDKSEPLELQNLSIEYTAIMKRVNRIVSSKYWGEIAKHPRDWTNPEGRLNEVREALKIIEKDIVSNIQRLNENKAMDFDLDLQMLRNVENSNPIETFKE